MYTAHQTSTKLIVSDTGPAGGEPTNLSSVALHSSPLSTPHPLLMLYDIHTKYCLDTFCLTTMRG